MPRLEPVTRTQCAIRFETSQVSPDVFGLETLYLRTSQRAPALAQHAVEDCESCRVAPGQLRSDPQLHARAEVRSLRHVAPGPEQQADAWRLPARAQLQSREGR